MTSPSITPEKPLLRVLGGHVAERPPFWLMRQAGRYLPEYRALRAEAGSFLDLCYTPRLAVEATLQPIRRFGMDAAILFSDILVVPHALGGGVEFREGEGPVLERITDGVRLAALKVEAVRNRLAPVYETVASVRAALPKEVTLIGFAGAPWTVASYMVEGGSSRDFLAVKRMAAGETPLFQSLIDMLVDATVEHLLAQIESGAEVVQLFDSWAGALPADALERWSIDPARRIVAALRDRHPGLPVIGFPRGVGIGYRRYAERTGVTAVSLDQSVPAGWAAEAMPAGMVLQGNLDPAYLVVGGTSLRAATERILAACRGRAHVFNLGHGVVPATPPEHVAALARILRGGDG